MKRILMAAALCLSASAATAEECNRFSLNTRPPGEVVAILNDETRELTMENQYSATVVYDLRGAGTGIEASEGTPRTAGEERILVLPHKGDLIVDMMVYEPYCP